MLITQITIGFEKPKPTAKQTQQRTRVPRDPPAKIANVWVVVCASFIVPLKNCLYKMCAS